MALPVFQRTWTITGNNRITFVSLLDTQQRYLHGVKTFLKAHAYTVKGSASAGTGAMDGVDRWTATTDVTPRGANSASSQAWIVLTDGSGVEILIAYQGASDDIGRISICADGTGFVAAGTPSNQPTSTNSNEQVVTSGTLINATASADRLWWGWVDSTHKMCRFAVARSGIWVGQIWGVEEVTPGVTAPCVFSPAAWGFSFTQPSPNVVFSTTSAGVARTVVSSVSKLCAVRFGVEYFGIDTFSDNIKAPAQGGIGFLMQGLSLGTATTGSEGKLGNVIDQWSMQGNTSTGVAGDTLGSLQFLSMGSNGNGRGLHFWPLDGVTTPTMT